MRQSNEKNRTENTEQQQYQQINMKFIALVRPYINQNGEIRLQQQLAITTASNILNNRTHTRNILSIGVSLPINFYRPNFYESWLSWGFRYVWLFILFIRFYFIFYLIRIIKYHYVIARIREEEKSHFRCVHVTQRLLTFECGHKVLIKKKKEAMICGITPCRTD